MTSYRKSRQRLALEEEEGKKMTVGELRKALAGVPDNYIVQVDDERTCTHVIEVSDGGTVQNRNGEDVPTFMITVGRELGEWLGEGEEPDVGTRVVQ